MYSPVFNNFNITDNCSVFLLSPTSLSDWYDTTKRWKAHHSCCRDSYHCLAASMQSSISVLYATRCKLQFIMNPCNFIMHCSRLFFCLSHTQPSILKILIVACANHGSLCVVVCASAWMRVHPFLFFLAVVINCCCIPYCTARVVHSPSPNTRHEKLKMNTGWFPTLSPRDTIASIRMGSANVMFTWLLAPSSLPMAPAPHGLSIQLLCFWCTNFTCGKWNDFKFKRLSDFVACSLFSLVLYMCFVHVARENINGTVYLPTPLNPWTCQALSAC